MYNVISGMRRSGTSMLILALRQAGIPVSGFKFPADEWIPNKRQLEGNLNGYWELAEITTDKGLLPDAQYIGMPGDLVKVMTECLYKSDPQMINKVIMIFRDPGKVIHSFIKYNIIEDLEMYITKNMFDVADSLDFLQYNKIPVKVVIYERILENPLKEMKAICKFLDNGDPKKAAKWIKPSLNRVSKEKYEGTDMMVEVYEWAKKGNISKIIKYKDYLKERGQKLVNKYDKEKPKNHD